MRLLGIGVFVLLVSGGSVQARCCTEVPSIESVVREKAALYHKVARVFAARLQRVVEETDFGARVSLGEAFLQETQEEVGVYAQCKEALSVEEADIEHALEVVTNLREQIVAAEKKLATIKDADVAKRLQQAIEEKKEIVRSMCMALGVRCVMLGELVAREFKKQAQQNPRLKEALASVDRTLKCYT